MESEGKPSFFLFDKKSIFAKKVNDDTPGCVIIVKITISFEIGE